MATNSSIILTYIAAENDVELQMTVNSNTKNLKARQSSNEIRRIHSDYDYEEELIRNEMKDLDDDKSSTEYTDLMIELRELQDEEDKRCEYVEDEAEEYETQIDLENDQLSAQLEAMKTDQEAFESAREDDTKETFGYFQN